MPPRPSPHGHGEEEEEDLGPRVDGPPFVDIVSKQGRGFEIDFAAVSKSLGPDKIKLSEFLRDIEAIDKVYLPITQRSYKYMKYGSIGMMAGLVIFIIMGIIGGTPEIRGVVIPISFTIFVVGMVMFLYSKYVEQGLIHESAVAAKRVIDEEVNPRHAQSPHRLCYTIGVHTREIKTFHMGKTLLERPIVTLWCLYSPNEEGKMTEWELPQAIMRSSSVTIRHSHTSVIRGNKGTGK